jgi:hypothetical protein
LSTFAFASSKLGMVAPETYSIAREIHEAATKAGHDIWFMWGMGRSGEHATGHALDLMVKNEAAGDFVRNYIWANRARLRLRHVIWEQHITSTVVQPGVRRLMADRGNTTENHFDHNHALFYSGAYQAPSLMTPVVKPKPKPKPAPKPVVKIRVLQRGSRGEDVKALQKGLNRVFPGYPGKLLTVDGVFGLETEKDVLVFQGRAGLTKDGKVGPLTRAALRKHGIRL